MKKVVITGHREGIGKALYDTFSTEGYDVIGFDIKDGYDINLSEIRTFIINQASNADIFINNAYSHDSQTILLRMILDSWHGLQKTIININSKICLIGPEFLGGGEFIVDYYNNKLEQLRISREHHEKHDYPILMNVLPGLVNTNFSKPLQNNEDYISPEVLAQLIFTNIQFSDKIAISELVVDSAIKQTRPNKNGTN